MQKLEETDRLAAQLNRELDFVTHLQVSFPRRRAWRAALTPVLRIYDFETIK